MKLFELFQASLPVKIFRDDARNFIGEFEDPDGNQYEFTVSELMKIDQDQPDIWSCQFSSGTDFLIGGRKSFLILSTMINIIRSQIKEKNISNLYFEARNSEKSRVSLYRKLCQTFAKQMGWHVREDVAPAGYTIFTLSKDKFPEDFWKMPSKL